MGIPFRDLNPNDVEYMTREHFFQLVREERVRQDAKWGSQREQSGVLWTTILTEEIGEVAQAVLKKDRSNLEEEMVQCAAVLSAWFEALYLGNDGTSY